MSTKANFDLLNDEELNLVDRFASFLLETRTRKEARARFETIWAEWTKRSVGVTEAEIESLVNEAVAEVRSGV